jgi:nucleolar protein involved in exit from mitosis
MIFFLAEVGFFDLTLQGVINSLGIIATLSGAYILINKNRRETLAEMRKQREEEEQRHAQRRNDEIKQRREEEERRLREEAERRKIDTEAEDKKDRILLESYRDLLTRVSKLDEQLAHAWAQADTAKLEVEKVRNEKHDIQNQRHFELLQAEKERSDLMLRNEAELSDLKVKHERELTQAHDECNKKVEVITQETKLLREQVDNLRQCIESKPSANTDEATS